MQLGAPRLTGQTCRGVERLHLSDCQVDAVGSSAISCGAGTKTLHCLLFRSALESLFAIIVGLIAVVLVPNAMTTNLQATVY